MPGAVLFFDCPEDEMEKRLLKRGETSGRTDDNAGKCMCVLCLVQNNRTQLVINDTCCGHLAC